MHPPTQGPGTARETSQAPSRAAANASANAAAVEPTTLEQLMSSASRPAGGGGTSVASEAPMPAHIVERDAQLERSELWTMRGVFDGAGFESLASLARFERDDVIQELERVNGAPLGLVRKDSAVKVRPRVVSA